MAGLAFLLAITQDSTYGHGNLANYVSCCVCVFLACQELPDEQALTPTNFGVFMTEQAVATKKLNEEVEKFKALLKTRGEL